MLDIKIVPKGWGFERWIVNKEEYCGKELFFIKGRKCSVHFHKLKDETFYVAEGKLVVRYLLPDRWKYDENKSPEDHQDEWKQCLRLQRSRTQTLEQGDTFYVPPMMIHQMTGLQDTRMFEFSTQHFESDSYRIILGDQ